VKRYFSSLRPGDQSIISALPGGLVLASVNRVQYRWHHQKPYYEVLFSVLEPQLVRGCHITGRLYCSEKALWKLNWFLRDFGYDPELLECGQVDERALVGLEGVLKISYATVRGLSVLNLDAFAPASQWHELSDEPNPEVKIEQRREPRRRKAS
jgi:hypothetical protein